MSKEEALRILLGDEDENETDLHREICEIKQMLCLILTSIVISQKNAALITGVSDDTIRNMVLRGETSVLSADGSRLNYLTLKQVGELKARRRSKRKRR